MAQSSLALFGISVVGGAVGAGLEFLSLQAPSPRPALLVAGALSVVVAVMRRRRRLRWQQTPLIFDDELPSDGSGSGSTETPAV